MDLTQAIVWWGLIAVACSALAGVLAVRKNREVSSWMAWCFVLPPLVLVLLILPKQTGLRRRRPALDEHD